MELAYRDIADPIALGDAFRADNGYFMTSQQCEQVNELGLLLKWGQYRPGEDTDRDAIVRKCIDMALRRRGLAPGDVKDRELKALIGALF